MVANPDYLKAIEGSFGCHLIKNCSSFIRTCRHCLNQASVAVERAYTSPNMARPQIILFGDSITQFSFDVHGWGGLLSHAYQRKADVLNRGYSGYNTTWALHGMHKVLPPGGPAPLLLTIFFGANDAALSNGSASRQHVPLDCFGANLREMVARGRAAGARHLVLITPPPVYAPDRVKCNKERYGLEGMPERTNEEAGRYASVCKEVAAELGVPVLDLWTQFQARDGWQTRLLCDGLHLSDEGNTTVYELLQQLVNRQCTGARVEELTLDLPLHSDIVDPAAYAAAFAEYLTD